MEDVLKRVKSENSAIQKAFLRSDNAGCYHGSQTIASVHEISRKSGIFILRWDFSDPQSGKGVCDRVSAWIKRKVRLYVDENNKCTNAKEFIVCASSYGGVKGTTVVYSKLHLDKASKAKIPGISYYNNFLFSDDKITAWRAYEIGPVIEIQKNIGLIN